MRLFLDASVLLAAAGSPNGSSRALFSYAKAQGWLLVSSPYGVVINNELHRIERERIPLILIDEAV